MLVFFKNTDYVSPAGVRNITKYQIARTKILITRFQGLHFKGYISNTQEQKKKVWNLKKNLSE
jgi:hypothetical protein